MERIPHLMPSGPDDGLVHRAARRRSARYPLAGEVTLTAPFEAEGFLFNASAGGLRMAIDRPVQVGARLELRVRFGEGEESEEAGEVVWCRELPDGWLVGLRFVEG